jgi:hypothetical protein
MDFSDKLLDFLLATLQATGAQLVWILGPLFLIGFLLYLVGKGTRNVFVSGGGSAFDSYFTGWLGTPVHEFGHAAFCVLFRHPIEKVRWYSPRALDGNLGFVNHTYDPKSTYQQIGNFFIGVGPIVCGTVVIYALLGLLLPHTLPETLASGGIFDTGWQFLKSLFSVENFKSWQFWVFFYLSLCITSHMSLSPADIKGGLRGLVSFVLLLLGLNLVAQGILAAGLEFSTPIHAGVTYVLSIFQALLVMALALSLLNFVVSWLLMSVISLVRGKGLASPF